MMIWWCDYVRMMMIWWYDVMMIIWWGYDNMMMIIWWYDDDDGMVMILRNAHCTTLYGNQISEYFNCYPPSLEEYFGVAVVD